MFDIRKNIEDYNNRKNQENAQRLPLEQKLVELKRLKNWMLTKFNIYNPKQITFLYRKVRELSFEDMPEIPVEMFYYNVEGAQCKIALDMENAQKEYLFFRAADPSMKIFEHCVTTDNFANSYFQSLAWAWKDFDPIFDFINRKIDELEKQLNQ